MMEQLWSFGDLFSGFLTRTLLQKPICSRIGTRQKKEQHFVKVQKVWLSQGSNRAPSTPELDALPLHHPGVTGIDVEELFMQMGILGEFLGARSLDVSGLESWF